MAQQFPPQQYKTRLALLVFLKGASAPMVLYFEDPKAVFDEILPLIRVQSSVGKLIEKDSFNCSSRRSLPVVTYTKEVKFSVF